MNTGKEMFGYRTLWRTSGVAALIVDYPGSGAPNRKHSCSLHVHHQRYTCTLTACDGPVSIARI